jgi:spermidine dehydrogenase
MSESGTRDLGMNRRILRRDFLNGVAIAVGTAAAVRPARARAAQPIPLDDTYPPRRIGLRGEYDQAVQPLLALERSTDSTFPGIDVETGETYDLVVVGGGLSGLATAYFWQKALGADQRILILDNHDDFGGHAKRNEFPYRGRTYVSFGGTMGISTPYPYSYAAKSLVADLGVDVSRNQEFLNRELFQTYQLGPATFFDKEHFGEDRLVVGTGRLPWPEFFAKAPLSDAAKRDLIRLYGKNPDYMAGKSAKEKIETLARISYQDYLLRYATISPDAIPYFLGQGGRNNKRVDTTPALEAAQRGSIGFDGLGLTFEKPFPQGSYQFHFPDGNASIARLLVSRLVPAAVTGRHDMSTIVQAPVAFDRLDQAGAPVRIRLESTVVRVAHEGPANQPTQVRLAYVRGGRMHGVRGRNVVLACFNSLIPKLVPDLPEAQKAALGYAVKVPMLYTNVLLRRWAPFKAVGAASVSSPGMYHTSCSIDAGSTVGGYRGITTPDEPAVIHMVRNPNKPGLPRKEQNRAGQQELLSMSFADFEKSIRQQLARTLAGTDFDPAADIVGIAVNRWPHGYAYTYDTLADPDVPPEKRPHVVGRQRHGWIAIANSDAGAGAFTNQAFDEAHRAVQELLIARGLS